MNHLYDLFQIYKMIYKINAYKNLASWLIYKYSKKNNYTIPSFGYFLLNCILFKNETVIQLNIYISTT